MDDSKGTTITNSKEVLETEATKAKLKVGKSCAVADVATLDIKSRLSLENTEVCEKPQTNGLHQVNGVCESLQRNTESTASTGQPQGMETSHLNLNQPGKNFQLTFDI